MRKPSWLPIAIPTGSRRCAATGRSCATAAWMPTRPFWSGGWNRCVSAGVTLDVFGADLSQLAGLDVIDETPNRDLLGNPGMRAQLHHLVADVLIQARKRVEHRRHHGGRARLPLEPLDQVMVLEGQHAAIGVVDDHEFLGP